MENNEFLERAFSQKPAEKAPEKEASHEEAPSKYAVNSRGEVLTEDEVKKETKEGTDAWREQK